MTAVTLYRVDAARNMSRFYRLDIQPDLFGKSCVVREWGRIGRRGRMRLEPYPTPAAAQAALDRQRRVKQRRGYSQEKTKRAIL
jgi:predicted DNA-binding WGR domain protein